jgi:hypothetical protein
MLLIPNAFIVMAFNFSHFMNDALDYAFTPFELYLNFMFWPIVMVWAIGLVYKATHHMSTTVMAIFVVFALWGTSDTILFSQIPELGQFFFIVSVVAWASVVLTFFVKKRYES